MKGVTTIEQSNRLQAAAILVETADAMWVRCANSDDMSLVLKPYSSWNIFTERKEDCVPAWSLAALWDMCGDQALSFSTQDDMADGIIEALVKRLIETSDDFQLL